MDYSWHEVVQVRKYFSTISIKSTAKNLIAKLLNKNTIGTYIMQVEKGVFAFVFLPVLASRLGISVFGVFSAYYSLGIIAGLVVDWGLSQTSIKSLAIAEDEKKSNLASAVVFTRLALTIPVSCIIMVLSFLALPLNGNLILAIFTILNIYAVSLSPVFIYQANEKTFEIGSILIFIRIIATILVYVYIKEPDDINLAFSIHLYTLYMGACSGWLILVAKYRFKLSLPSAGEIRLTITNGFDFAFANIGSSLYGNGSVFLLSLVSSSVQVGVFSLALTFTRGVCSVLTPISQSYLPKISRLYEESYAKARSAVIKAIILQTIVGFALIVMVWIVMIYVLYTGSHDNIREMSLLIILLSPTIISTLISCMLVLFVIIPMGANSFYKNLIFISSIIGSAFLLFLGYLYQSYGAAISIMVTEVLICIVILNYSLKTIKYNLK